MVADADQDSDTDTEPQAALSVRGLRKVYGGTVALADVDVDVRPGEIHGLLGENGAGKSTLVRLLAGVEPSDGGAITVGGHHLPPRFAPDAIAALGVAIIHQNLGLIEDMSVAENVALAVGYAHSGPMISWKQTRQRARQALDTMGVDLDPDLRAGDLPMSMRSVVAIARALLRDVRLLVLDEPTATLGVHEVDSLFAILRRLRDQGVAIVLITHRLEEVIQLTDRVTVLRDGRVVASRETAEMSEADLVAAIVGTELAGRPARSSSAGDTVLRFDGAVAGSVGPLDFEIRAGEVVAITGLSGAGHHVVSRMLTGQQAVRRGRITLHGQPFAPRGPQEALARGCWLLPADRNGEGAVPSMSLRENLHLNPRRRWLHRIRRRREQNASRETLVQFDVRPPQPEAEFSTLSGGNAQKVVLARCLSGQPRLLVMEEPTAAVDVRARSEIHQRIRSLAASGCPVVLIGSDLEEVEQVCDRAIVMERGRIRGVLSGEAVTAASLLQAAYGVDE